MVAMLRLIVVKARCSLCCSRQAEATNEEQPQPVEVHVTGVAVHVTKLNIALA